MGCPGVMGRTDSAMDRVGTDAATPSLGCPFVLFTRGEACPGSDRGGENCRVGDKCRGGEMCIVARALDIRGCCKPGQKATGGTRGDADPCIRGIPFCGRGIIVASCVTMCC
eukprot:5980757-Amphidinium_carterae.2